MLKPLFATPAIFAACAALAAAQASLLEVGSIRDTAGRPVGDATVRAFDVSGRVVGSGTSALDGTFALQLSGPASQVEVRCVYCATARVAAGDGNVAVVVTRFAALVSDVPSHDDLVALPYQRIGSALALIPFMVATGNANAISDRGLGKGQGLVLEDGAPVLDLATGSSALADFPDRYVRSIAVAAPSQAYRYGTDAGGGVFALDQMDDVSSLMLAGGVRSSAAILPDLGDIVYPGAGISSSNDGRIARRADLDVDTPFAGGQLRVGASSATSSYYAVPNERSISGARLAYATASRNYRTSFDLSTDTVATAGSAFDYRACYLTGDFTLERPGPVDWTVGARITRQTARYDRYAPPFVYELDGSSSDETVFLSASGGGAAAGYDAGVALVANDRAKFNLIPSLTGHAALGGGFYARAGYSEALDTPSLLQAAAELSPLPLERSELAEAAVGFDAGGRVRAEAMAFREMRSQTSDFMNGAGPSVVWQVAPTISVRAWALAASDKRDVGWVTYASGPHGLRVDAIVRRDMGTALDGSITAPLFDGASVGIGTSRERGVRRFQTFFTLDH